MGRVCRGYIIRRVAFLHLTLNPKTVYAMIIKGDTGQLSRRIFVATLPGCVVVVKSFPILTIGNSGWNRRTIASDQFVSIFFSLRSLYCGLDVGSEMEPV
jgi:hypothetical protein